MNGGWTPEGHLLATQIEQQAGLNNVTRRIPRQSVSAEPKRPVVQNPNRIDSFDSLTLAEFERLRAANYAKGPSPTRRIGPQRT